jgi:predicted small secreted protein
MKTHLKQVVLFFLALGFMALVGAGCQTTKGLGKDVEKLGEKIQGD